MTIVIVTAACSKNDGTDSETDSGTDSLRISPPEWIHGEWEWVLVYEDSFMSLNYLFSSKDIILTAKSDTRENPVILVFSDVANSNNLWIVNETLKTNEIYEVTLTGPTQTVYYFKKGDGTYIEGGTDKENLMKLNKK